MENNELRFLTQSIFFFMAFSPKAEFVTSAEEVMFSSLLIFPVVSKQNDAKTIE